MGVDAELIAKFDLSGKVAVVTGAGSGLGQEMARVLSLAGARLLLADVNDDGLKHTAALLQGHGADTLHRVADVTDPGAMDALALSAVEHFGGLDIWINSAGLPLVAPVLDTTAEAAAPVVAVNMMGTFWGCAAAARHMPSGGSIINISSGGGDRPVPCMSIYCMTKAAVNQLTLVCAQEFGSAGIRVNAIAPAWNETPMGTSLFRDERGEIDEAQRERVRAEQAAANPLGRNSTAEDIAMTALYLASDASGFVNGQVLHVDGGARG
ncbi:SDR family NAD(P)-dependent oxidoreductase [Haliea sp. E17]|uniref:SDR family NAD(P)-dependent oxidoreductase n=1 Tax=Haliea sp. E17 TaxID=3401576 RepID=UPI003AB0721B